MVDVKFIIAIVVIILMLPLGYYAYSWLYAAPQPTFPPTSSGISSAFSSGSGAVTQTCPVCPVCQACPDCECPECPACNCGGLDVKLESSKLEIENLKWMVRFLGALVKRENALNRALLEQCPTLYGMVPFIQQNEAESLFLQNIIKKNAQINQYFQVYFTKLSGLPSDSFEQVV